MTDSKTSRPPTSSSSLANTSDDIDAPPSYSPLPKSASPPLTSAPAPARHHQLLGPTNPGLTPLIICFHGSGSEPLPSWDILIAILARTYRVLLYDRGPRNPSPETEIPVLQTYLTTQRLKPRYILLAHSYGGAFAKLFLHRRPEDVAGLVLVETGQEGGVDAEMWRQMIRRKVLADLPLVVVRGNSLLRQWRDLELEEREQEGVDEEQEERTLGKEGNPHGVQEEERNKENAKERETLKKRRAWLEAADVEDEKLKKAQLALSRNAKYVHLADCGHDVIRARPELVADEVRWAVEQLVFARRGQKSTVVKEPWWRVWISWALGSERRESG